MKTIKPLHNPHPGETLKEALEDYEISQYRLGQDLEIPHSRITAIIKGRQGVTATTALKLGKYFGTLQNIGSISNTCMISLLPETSSMMRWIEFKPLPCETVFLGGASSISHHDGSGDL